MGGGGGSPPHDDADATNRRLSQSRRLKTSHDSLSSLLSSSSMDGGVGVGVGGGGKLGKGM